MIMRDIKFRAWVFGLDEYLLDFKIINSKFDYVGKGIEITTPRGCPIDMEKNISNGEYILEQYIGIKDTGGVEIYEGDIVSSQPCKGRVFYSEDYSSFMIESVNCGVVKLSRKFVEQSGLFVVGNIHENQEIVSKI